MPLHLLGKKSWNPYSPAAIARVQADEEAHEELQRDYAEKLSKYESQRRLAGLRGVAFSVRPPTPPPERIDKSHVPPSSEQNQPREKDGFAKHRRLRGEDDTERDLRLARSHVAEPARKHVHGKDRALEVDITDRNGHIQLFEAPRPPGPVDRKKQRQDEEAESGMRFKHAAGYQQDVKQATWYSGTEALDDSIAKRIADENERSRDESWQKREQQRIDSADPLAKMRASVRKMKETKRARDAANEEREIELHRLREQQERASRREERLKTMQQREAREDKHHDRRNSSKSRRRQHHRALHGSWSRSRSRSRSPEREHHPTTDSERDSSYRSRHDHRRKREHKATYHDDRQRESRSRRHQDPIAP